MRYKLIKTKNRMIAYKVSDYDWGKIAVAIAVSLAVLTVVSAILK